MKTLFNETIELLRKYQQDSSLNSGQRAALGESIARLESVSEQYEPIMGVSANLFDGDDLLRDMDKMMAKYFSSNSIVVEKLSKASAYDMSNIGESSPMNAEKIKKLHSDTESIYEALWLIKTRMQALPILKNFNPRGVCEVRNHLMAHTEGKSSGAYQFTFGLSPQGPILRPGKPASALAPHDAGLEVNIKEFLAEIIRMLS